MRQHAHNEEERRLLLKQRAARGEIEFALCAVALLPGGLFTLLVFWFIYRGSDLARMFGCAYALILVGFSWLVAYLVADLGQYGGWIVLGLTIAWGVTAAVLALSPNLQAYQELKRDRGRPRRRQPRRIR